MSDPAAGTELRTARPTVDPAAAAETADILRQLAAADRITNPARGQVSATLAAPMAVTAQHQQHLPAEVGRRVLDVMHAVDAATGHRR